ncbi:MAG: hypothetical protein WC876_11610 [Candidatus Thermoplasmatota archaeon]
MQMADQLAAVPFLPHGKGALILILGGLAVLPASLLWSRASSGTQRWVAGIVPGAIRLGLGPCRVVSADVHSCVVVLSSCPSCRSRAKPVGNCAREQQGLQTTVAPRAPDARVVELSCNPSGRGACTFVIHRGRSP